MLAVFLALPLFSQVTANFTPSVSSGCNPTTVRFTNNTIGVAVSFSWDFGNGKTSVLTSPSVIYTKAGIYDVTLTAKDASGNSSTHSQKIKIYKNPVVKFTAARTCCELDIIDFTNTTVAGDTGIKNWSWDFGDGVTSISENPSHQYLTEGKYAVTLLAEDSNGCTSDTTYFDYITVRPKPEAEFTFPATRHCKAPIKVDFTNTTFKNFGDTYSWDFGDGSGTASTYHATYTYSTFGKYDVSLAVTNAFGCSDTLTVKGEIELRDLSIDFIIPEGEKCVNNEVTFIENIQPKLTTATAYNWRIPGSNFKSGKEVTANLGPGIHKVRLEVNNKDCYDTLTKFIEVFALPENRMVLGDSLICSFGQWLDYEMDSSGLDSFSWDILGNRTSKNPSGSVFVDSEGPHVFHLYQRDRNGCEVTYTDTVQVAFPEVFLGEDTGACAPYDFLQTFKYKGMYDVVSYVWRYDGQTSDSFIGENPPKFSYTDTGYYYIELEVTDELGCKSSSIRSVGAGIRPDIDIDWDKDTVCNGEDILYEHIYYGDVRPNSWFWQVGAATSLARDPEFALKEYPSDLAIFHSAAHYGCHDTIIVDSAITVLGPFARFSQIYDSCIDAQRKTVSEVVGADSFWYILSGVYLTSDSVFNYSFEDETQLSLYAANAETGCMDSMKQTMIVKDSAQLKWSISSTGCVPMDLSIAGTALNLDSVQWRFNGTPFKNPNNAIDYTFLKSGSVRFSLHGYAGDCKVVLDSTFTANGPRTSISTNQSPGCLPKTYTLNDSFWNDTGGFRYWIVDGDTIESTQFETKVTINSVKDPSTGIISFQLLAGEDSCYSTSQVNYRYPGLRFETRQEDSIISCDEYLYTFRFYVNPEDSAFVDNYGISYNNTHRYSKKPEFQQVIKADGNKDTIYLRVKGLSGCVNTQMLILEAPVPALQADFSYTDPESTCPPLLVQFKDKSYSKLGPVKERRWYVDGEFFSALANPSRIFTLTGRYNISLKVTDDQGCIDSVFIDSLVRIEGDPVEVDFGVSKLCLYDTVEFNVVNGNAKSYEWDMGDGSVLTGSNIIHEYALPGTYSIIMLVTDSQDCSYPMYPEDSIHVVALPDVSFEVNGPCRNKPVDFKNTSTSEEPIEFVGWAIGSFTSSQDSFTLSNTDFDKISVTLAVMDTVGCTNERTENVKLYDLQADFSLSEAAFCLNDTVRGINLSSADTGIQALDWFLNESYIGSGSPFEFFATAEGNLDMKLRVADDAGCIDSISKSEILKVLGPNSTQEDLMKRVTVLPDNTLQVEWKETESPFFESYSIFRNGTSIEITDIKDTLLILPGVDASLGSVCLKMGMTSICSAPSLDSLIEHCSVRANGRSDTLKRCIDWNAYEGWDVRSYYIYREDNGMMMLIDSVPGTRLSYCDTGLQFCAVYKTYKIEARGSRYRSNSDTARVKPIWHYTIDPPVIQNVSVNLDQQIEITIDSAKTPFLPFQGFEYERLSQNGVLTKGNFNQTGLHMNTADTDKEYYTYQIRQKDVCDGTSNWSSPSRTIHLQMQTQSSSIYPKLTWNRSAVWTDGISYYKVERQVSETEFESIATLNDINDTSYVDELLDAECASLSCYRVTAVSVDQNWESHSNIVCSNAESMLFVPNAFTMNGDNLNETFQPRGVFIDRYTIVVFNRWGEVLFTSDNCMDGWDGTFNGEPVQQGVYFYSIYATGIDLEVHIRKGTITLLR
ncbi:PKD domain-containing protein [bacterium]|nr:PKD domain-containing protein [bacterium]